jgi:hypothetical protein
MFLNENFIPPAWMFVRLSTYHGTHGIPMAERRLLRGGERGIKKWSAPIGKPPPKGGVYRRGPNHFFIPSVTHTFNMGGECEFDYE